MENIIVATFKDEKGAVEGLHKLNKLQAEGDISIYDHVLIRKNTDATYEVLKEDDSAGWRTLVGMTVGGLVGAFGGPIGFAVGLYAGTAIGVITDIGHYAFEKDFIDNFSKNVPNGASAIIADVDEDSAIFIDNYLKPLGATILRSNVYTEQGKYVQTQVDELDAEILNAENELKKAAETEKEKITNKVTKLRNKRDAKFAEIKAKSEEKMHEFQEKLESSRSHLKEQMSDLKSAVSDKIADVEQAQMKKKITKYENRIAEYESKVTDLNSNMNKFKVAKTG